MQHKHECMCTSEHTIAGGGWVPLVSFQSLASLKKRSVMLRDSSFRTGHYRSRNTQSKSSVFQRQMTHEIEKNICNKKTIFSMLVHMSRKQNMVHLTKARVEIASPQLRPRRLNQARMFDHHMQQTGTSRKSCDRVENDIDRINTIASCMSCNPHRWSRLGSYHAMW